MRPDTIDISNTLRLRPYQETDTSIYKLANNPTIAENLGPSFPSPYTEKSAQEWIPHVQKIYDNTESPETQWVIEVDGTLAGSIGIDRIVQDNASIGYWIGEPYWGGGIGTQVLEAAVNYAFTQTPLRYLHAEVYSHNTPSKRLLEKIGFTHIGTRRENYTRKNGERVDTLMFDLLKEEYKK